MTQEKPTPDENEENAEQFIESFHTYLEDLQDPDEASDIPEDATPTIIPHLPYSTEHHILSLKIPAPLWQILQDRCPRRGITNFILQATHEKLQRSTK